ncbi:hypothetical protein BP5796_06546 [Coleophoma crateriformis]|uniref:DUF300-domain-containing protein n=1 Tax=Coleophoma crateriformis TaxID=565419 RepID=A0A3D8RNZ1_9HELO|nr:hypothetical protein BP5796_06546 [Coleophoma crateriformis]
MGSHHSKTAVTCPVADTSNDPTIVPVVGNLTFHTLSIIIGGGCAVLASIVAIFLIIQHATHFSNPAEQKQIIRILCIIPSFALISFLSIWLSSAAEYLKPGLSVVEAFPLAAFFLLMSTYCVPDEDLNSRATFFSQLQLQNRKGVAQGGGSLGWYRQRSFLVLQFIPVSILMWIVAVAALATGHFCSTSNNIHFAHIWVTVITTISTIVAIMSILHFYRRMKPTLQPHKTMAKLISFKLIVFLNFLQTLVFSFLTSSSRLKPTAHLSASDISTGLPNLLLCLEILLFTPLFIYAYSSSPYILRGHARSTPSAEYYMGGVGGLSALWDALNIVDIALALFTGSKTKISSRASGAGRMSRGGYAIPLGRESPEYGPDEMGRRVYKPRGSLQHLRDEEA